jgi:hypothetical protein
LKGAIWVLVQGLDASFKGLLQSFVVIDEVNAMYFSYQD